ncbi:hypothetical protein GCM10008014_48530 [Paenibacillus silvae]|uniref:DUF3951 domain-containing protein n=1 Tax=Paenibacillus silvae TaxID=1325358 RepID=A0ABQ1ZK96_9BACL|nr:hypothetical protein GCM10008014_48530 [Paenibacillus silvae]
MALYTVCKSFRFFIPDDDKTKNIIMKKHDDNDKKDPYPCAQPSAKR